MSQSSIKRSPLLSDDWMRELEMDAQKMQSLVSRLDELARKALFDMGHGNTKDAGIRLLEIREGLQLLCELCGVKMIQA